MKTATLTLAAISLIELAAAQPRKRHIHQAQHLQKRDVVTVVETVVAFASSVPEVLVYVDTDGKIVSSETHTVSSTATFSTISAATPTSTPVIAAAAVLKAAETSTSTTTSSSTPVETSTVAAPVASTPPVAGGFGYAYSPYNSDHTCKSAEQVLQDFAGFASSASVIRTYGVDCNTVANVYPAVKKYNLKLFAGIFSLSDIAGQVQTLVSGVGGDWSHIYGISVGNELVDSHQADAGSVIAAVQTAKALLSNAGWNGLVSTVDTLQATLQYPELCTGELVCTVNCHPFFDPNTPSSGAGDFLTKSIANLRSRLADPNQQIFISETGWPHQGNTNGQAVPSPQDQASALSSIKAAVPNAIILSAYNTYWKESNAAQFDAEKFWGVFGDSPSG